MLRFAIGLMLLIGVGSNTPRAQEPAATTTPASETDPTAARNAASAEDPLSEMQSQAMKEQKSPWAHWGNQPDRYSTWVNHSNRLVPVYTFGITLDMLRDEGSVYADQERLRELYGNVPEGTLHPTATYYDQTDIHRLQLAAIDAGYTNIILIVFDGMDWQTTRAAALYQQRGVRKRRSGDGTPIYTSGRGRGLSFLNDRRVETDFGLICTSPLSAGTKFDVNSQTLLADISETTGGYNPVHGGEAPWHEQSNRDYLLGLDRTQPHSVTDSAASATSMTSGIKTYNGAINIAADGSHVVPIARVLQDEQEFKVGIVTNVPVSHATPAAAYANNVTRVDYQDISRDLLGLPSSSHRDEPLAGVDVLIGGGWGEVVDEDAVQGENFMVGNRYMHAEDIRRANIKHGGKYIVAQRTEGESGRRKLMAAARRAADRDDRLLGYYGTSGGHLPFQTADGDYRPTFDMKGSEKYTRNDIDENPTLADMTRAALLVLEQSIDGFWLMVEAGDVDWANHANNLDNSIGAVLSGDEAFRVVMDWVDENDAWPDTAVIVTADHGHFLVLDDPSQLVRAGQRAVEQRRERPKRSRSSDRSEAP